MISWEEAIVSRNGKDLKILYFLRKSAEVDKRLEMVEVTIKTVRDKFDQVFQNNLKEMFELKKWNYFSHFISYFATISIKLG